MTAPINMYRGDSIPVAKVINVTPVGPIVAGQLFAVWCNLKPAWYVAQLGDSIGAVVAGLSAAITAAAATIPEFNEFVPTASADGNTLILTAAVPGVPFDVACTCSGNLTVVETTAGHGGQNENWSVALIGAYTGGTFTITCNVGGGNVTTGNIAYNAAASAVQTALTALAGVGAGQVLVVGGPGPSSPWYVTWTGTLGNQSIAAGTVNGTNLTGGAVATVAEQQHGNGLSDDIQFIDISAVSGGSAATLRSFTLTLAGQTTTTLTNQSTAANVQSALQALANVGSGNVLVYAAAVSSGYFLTYAVHFTGALAQASVALLTINLIGTPQSNVFTQKIQNGGLSTSDDMQWLDLGLGAVGTDQTFSVTYAGQTTSNVHNGPVNVPASTLQADLQALSTIGTGNVLVYGPKYNQASGEYVNGYLIRQTGSLANTPASSYTATVSAGSGATITRLTGGGANLDEIQTITVAATGGTFTLTLGAQTTSAIAYNASTSTVQTRIQTDLSSTVTACTVTGTGAPGSPYVVTFTNPADTAIALMTAGSGSLTGGAGTITETQAGSAGANEVQTLTLAAGVSGGTFTLAFGTATTAPLAYNCSAAQMQAALKALSTINTVTVSGSAGGPWTVTWSGAQASTQEALLVADGSLLTGMSTNLITLSTATFSSGPNHYNDPTNWSLGRVPNTLDAVLFDLGSSSCLYGLQQIAVVTASSSANNITWAAGTVGGNAGNGSTAGSFITGQTVSFTNSGGALPGGISGATSYYLVNVNRDAGTAQLATTLGGTPITITSNGTGVQTMGARLYSIEETERFGGNIGLARQNAAGYLEYRPRYLHVGLATIAQGGAQTVTIGTDSGNGSPKTQIDNDVDQAAWIVDSTGGSSDTDARDLLLKGTNTANTLEQISGDVALALFEGETCNLATIKLRGGTLELGPGVTVGTSITRTGGTLICDGCTINGTLAL
ncbi:MAG: hypothetical protein KGL39_22540 [Patescibacteria group bacterium]|nr:hypothetical protein [Patescibacteria group bacterium]